MDDTFRASAGEVGEIVRSLDHLHQSFPTVGDDGARGVSVAGYSLFSGWPSADEVTEAPNGQAPTHHYSPIHSVGVLDLSPCQPELMCLPHVDVSASNLDPSSLEGCTATLSLDPSPRNPHLYNIDPVTFLPQNIMKVTIKKWNTVATWRWDIPEDDVCGICQVHFDGTCPTCKYPGDDCSLCK